MRPEVFVDTSAWLAISNSRDEFHPRAIEEHKRLLKDRKVYVTTNLVIGEAFVIIRRTGGHSKALQFLESLKTSPRVNKIYSTSSLEDTAEVIIRKFEDQSFSYVDAVSFAAMTDRGLTDAFCFDHHFAVMGFRVLPSKHH